MNFTQLLSSRKCQWAFPQEWNTPVWETGQGVPPSSSPQHPTAGWELKGPPGHPFPAPLCPTAASAPAAGWGGTPHETPREGQGFGDPPVRFCPPESPREQLKRSSDGDTKGLSWEALSRCPPGPYPPLRHLSHRPRAPPHSPKSSSPATGGSQHPERGDTGGTHGGPHSRSIPGPVLPLQSRLPCGVPQSPSPVPPINGTGVNWEALLGTLGAAGWGQSDSGARGTHDPPKSAWGWSGGSRPGPRPRGGAAAAGGSGALLSLIHI